MTRTMNVLEYSFTVNVGLVKIRVTRSTGTASHITASAPKTTTNNMTRTSCAGEPWEEI